MIGMYGCCRLMIYPAPPYKLRVPGRAPALADGPKGADAVGTGVGVDDASG